MLLVLVKIPNNLHYLTFFTALDCVLNSTQQLLQKCSCARRYFQNGDQVKMKLFIIFLFLWVASFSAYAGTGSGHAQIEHLGNWNGKDLLFFYTTIHTGEPACNTYQKRWVLDLSTELGKMQYSLLLSAQMAGKNIELSGADDCSIWPNSETVAWVGFPVQPN